MANRKVVPGFIVLLLSPPSFTSFFVLFVLSVHYDGHYDQDNNSWPPEAQKLHDYLSSHTCSFDHFVRIHFCPSRLCRSSSGGRPATSRSFWPASSAGLTWPRPDRLPPRPPLAGQPRPPSQELLKSLSQLHSSYS